MQQGQEIHGTNKALRACRCLMYKVICHDLPSTTYCSIQEEDRGDLSQALPRIHASTLHSTNTLELQCRGSWLIAHRSIPAGGFRDMLHSHKDCQSIRDSLGVFVGVLLGKGRKAERQTTRIKRVCVLKERRSYVRRMGKTEAVWIVIATLTLKAEEGCQSSNTGQRHDLS